MKARNLQQQIAKKHYNPTGSFAYKNILRYNKAGKKVISKERYGRYYLDNDYISAAYTNPDGTKVPYCIPLDIDAKDTAKKWLDESGQINWTKAFFFLKKTYPEIFKYILFVVRSTGGKGIHIGLAISPIIKNGDYLKQEQMARQLQLQLIRLLIHHGLGADRAATGLTRDLPNWRRKITSKYSQAKQLYFDEALRAKIKREKISVLTQVLQITNKLKECIKPPKKETPNLVHKHRSTEARLAHLYLDLFDCLGEAKCYTMRELVELTGISKETLRNILVRRPTSRPKWLKVKVINKQEGYDLWLDPEFGDPERAEKLVAGLIVDSRFQSDLSCPSLVQQGHRNEWLSSAAIHLKWHGISQQETFEILVRQGKLIPDYQKSSSYENISKIIDSVYVNHPETWACKRNEPIPEVLTLEYFEKIKKIQKAPQGVSGLVSLSYLRRGGRKLLLAYTDDSILAEISLEGNGHIFQLKALQKTIKALGRCEFTIRGKSLLKDHPVTEKLASFHKIKISFASRSKTNKELFALEYASEKEPTEVEDFKIPAFKQAKVRMDGFVCYGLSYYYVGPQRKESKSKIWVLEQEKQIEIYKENERLVTYQKLKPKQKTHSDSRPWQDAMLEGSFLRRKARKVGPYFDQLILNEIRKGQGIINTKSIFSFFSLIGKWPNAHLELAAKHCSTYLGYNFRYFKSFLEAEFRFD